MNMAFKKFLGVFYGLLLIAVGYLLSQIGFFEFFMDPWEREDYIIKLYEHFELVLYSMSLAIITGVGCGILFSRERFKRFAPYAEYIAGLGQTIPTLAILALSMSLFGIGKTTAIFTLFVISIIPILRNTLVGLKEISPSLIDAAEGLGLRKRDILLKIELPNAMPIIITGIRVAFVINIGTAALGYLIGAGGLGEVIFTGIQVQETNRLLAGCLPVIFSALFIDYLLDILSLVLIPKGLQLQHSSTEGT